MEELDTKHKLKSAFINLFPDAVPGNNGDIKSFTDFKKEYRSITKGVGVRARTRVMILKLTGDDVQDFLHRISTNDIKELGVFKQINTLFTNEKGRLIDQTNLMKIGDYYLLISNLDPEKRLWMWMEKYIIMEDIKIEDVTENYTLFDFYGSQADSFMTMMCGDKCSDLDGEKITIGETDSIKTYFSKVKVKNDIYKYVAVVDSEDAVNFIKLVNDRKSAFDLNFIGDRVFEYFRIVNGIPDFPNEINSQYNPHEINLITEVSFTKGCYIGQEVIARLDTYDKVQRVLKGVKLNLDSELDTPIDILDKQNEICGSITSLSQTELSDKCYGLALIRRKSLENETKFFIKNNEKKIELELSEFPIEE